MIYSKKLNVFYKGSTSDVNKRFKNHLDGKSTYTSRTNDWELVFVREFETKTEALAYEKMLKRQNHKYLHWIILQPYNIIDNETF